MLQIDHVTRLWGTSLFDCQTKPFKRAGKSARTEYADLACHELMFAPPDCISWLLWREADRPLNVFEVSKGLSPLLTGQEHPFE